MLVKPHVILGVGAERARMAGVRMWRELASLTQRRVRGKTKVIIVACYIPSTKRIVPIACNVLY